MEKDRFVKIKSMQNTKDLKSDFAFQLTTTVFLYLVLSHFLCHLAFRGPLFFSEWGGRHEKAGVTEHFYAK